MNPVPEFSGGCQCGAVRFHVRGALPDRSICHCRMCQKAFGSFFAPLVSVDVGDLRWTRGEPSFFSSSELVERGFCAECGTPLSFRYLNKPRINISIGSLDDPAAVRPEQQYGVESRMPWFADLARLPSSRTEDDIPADMRERLASRQHPDHE